MGVPYCDATKDVSRSAEVTVGGTEDSGAPSRSMTRGALERGAWRGRSAGRRLPALRGQARRPVNDVTRPGVLDRAAKGSAGAPAAGALCAGDAVAEAVGVSGRAGVSCREEQRSRRRRGDCGVLRHREFEGDAVGRGARVATCVKEGSRVGVAVEMEGVGGLRGLGGCGATGRGGDAAGLL